MADPVVVERHFFVRVGERLRAARLVGVGPVGAAVVGAVEVGPWRFLPGRPKPGREAPFVVGVARDPLLAAWAAAGPVWAVALPSHPGARTPVGAAWTTLDPFFRAVDGARLTPDEAQRAAATDLGELLAAWGEAGAPDLAGPEGGGPFAAGLGVVEGGDWRDAADAALAHPTFFGAAWTGTRRVVVRVRSPVRPSPAWIRRFGLAIARTFAGTPGVRLRYVPTAQGPTRVAVVALGFGPPAGPPAVERCMRSGCLDRRFLDADPLPPGR